MFFRRGVLPLCLRTAACIGDEIALRTFFAEDGALKSAARVPDDLRSPERAMPEDTPDNVIGDAFPDSFVFRLEESGPQSRYKVGDLEFCFRTKAEALLPVALASMVSKYVREVIMIQFNRFWQSFLPDLRPTKGYPQDAKRFWEEIKSTAAELGIEKQEIWRCR